MKLDPLSPGGSIAVGVVVGLVSTSIQSLGLTLQRKSHILEEERAPNDVRRPPHRRRRWQLGMLMFIVSNLLGSSIQITTLPLPILSPLQASGLVFNSICATLILGEPFTRLSLAGTLLVCVGAVIIAIFGAMKEPAHSLDELLFLLGRRPFVLWMIGQALLVGTIVVGTRILRALTPRTVNAARMRLARGIAYGSVSGILSAHSLLVAKTAVELLVRTIVDRINQFNRWQSWIILIGLIALALSQLYYLHCGLKLCSTSILYPLVFCIYNIVAILDGLLYFRQTSKLSVLHALLIAVGTGILLSGVLALSWRLSSEPTQTPVSQSALVPGMGFVDDTSDDDEDGYYRSDEEIGMGGERQPLLQGDPLSPTTKYDKLLSATRLQRHGMTEADEIWGELEDDVARYPAPLPRRSTSGISTASRLRRSEDDTTHEATSLFRSITTRNNRSRRKRLGSSHFRKPSGEQSPPAGTSKNIKPQSALGGWWRLEWWKGRKARTPVPSDDEIPSSES